MKKILALFLATLMLMGTFALTATAEVTETDVTLEVSEVGAVAGSVYEVILKIEEATVGGIQGTVNYNAEKFTFKDVTMSASVAAANRINETAGEAVKAEDGKIKFILLGDGVSTELITFNFTVNDADAVGKADFTLSDVKVSNAAGTATVTNNDVNAEGVSVSPVMLTANGSSIRTDGTYDLRFEMALDPEFAADVKEVGMILIPTVLVAEGKEIVNDANGGFCVSGVKPNIAKLDYDVANEMPDDDGFYKIYGNILNTGANHMNRLYSLRAYVKLSDGTVVYSDNENAEKLITNGAASRSCKTTAVAIYEAYKANYTYSQDALDAIANTGKWTEDEYKAVAKDNLAALAAALNK